MTDFHKLVTVPPNTDINTGVTYCKSETALAIFGRPGRLTQDCSPVTSPKLVKRIVTADVGPFKVTGLDKAVESLKLIFAEVKASNPELYKVVRTAGMLCCRAIRGSSTHFSNHSFGCAIDLKIESDLDELGADHVQQGILLLYPYFHKYGWYWGAGFSRKDVMHMEAADETLRKWENYSG